MKILVVEDDPGMSAAVREGLDEAGYSTHVVRDGQRALKVAQTGSFALIVLDIMLPNMDGLEICRQLRKSRKNVPILMVTARDAVPDRIKGLEVGADDYLVKPFEFDELLARVRALRRRDQAIKSSRIEIDDLVLDTQSRTVTRGGREILLTVREYKLLEALAVHCGRILTRDSIQERVWADETSVSNTVEVCVMNLRKKVDEKADRKLIHTVHRVGYVMRTDPHK